MYKSKLQNLCQLRQWELPVYTPLKTGPDHNPTFTATVTVNGSPYSSTEPNRNSKEAQNSAAKLAFDSLSAADVHVSPAVAHVAPPPPSSGHIEGSTTLVNASRTEVTSKKFIDSTHLYKNRLQNYALKKNLPLPVYSCEREGPLHAPRFRCNITFQGKTSEVSEFYSTIKEAEHAAAKNAWESWSLDDVQQDDTALYKNLLQEYLQRNGCPVPKYETTISGPSHMPNFVSKVNIKGHIYEGQAALSKKQAESHVAKVAYFGLQDHSNMTEELKEDGNSELCIRPHIETQQGFNSGYRIKEALEVSSSILQSVIAKAADFPVNLTPDVNLHIPAGMSEEYAANTDEAPPLSPETDNSAKRVCLPSSDLFDFDSSKSSSIESHNVHQQEGLTDTKTTSETVVVRPYVPNMTYPVGACILPFSDDKWMAIKMNSKS